MTTKVWRFQCDIAIDETDPTVTVFMGPVITPEGGGTPFVFQDVTNPTTVKMSELSNPAALINHEKMAAKRAEDTKKRNAAQANMGKPPTEATSTEKAKAK